MRKGCERSSFMPFLGIKSGSGQPDPQGFALMIDSKIVV